jgi:hypothetical protein
MTPDDPPSLAAAIADEMAAASLRELQESFGEPDETEPDVWWVGE